MSLALEVYHDVQGLACVGLKTFRGKQEALRGGGGGLSKHYQRYFVVLSKSQIFL